MKFKFYQMDIKTAFLHGDLPEEVFLKQTLNFESEEYRDHVYRLEKVIYGLKQARKAWYEKLSNYLLENRYKHIAIDNTLFTKHSGSQIILSQVYVDDNIFGSTEHWIH